MSDDVEVGQVWAFEWSNPHLENDTLLIVGTIYPDWFLCLNLVTGAVLEWPRNMFHHTVERRRRIA